MRSGRTLLLTILCSCNGQLLGGPTPDDEQAGQTGTGAPDDEGGTTAPDGTSGTTEDPATGDGDVGDPTPPPPADDSGTTGGSTTPEVGTLARVCNADALNQRTGPGTSFEVLRAMPSGSTVTLLTFQNGWYENDWGGRVGWSSGQYLCQLSDTESTAEETADAGASFDISTLSRVAILSIARAAVGFSYWWGGGRFATGAAPGSCYGSCPDCSHSGSYGGDCSGFVAKAWLLPAALPMDENSHPYSTAEFYDGGGPWSEVSRSSLLQADAMVYRSGGSGHVLLYESGDAWGQPWTYESRGCSYGVVHNIRSVSSSYKGIRRSGL